MYQTHSTKNLPIFKKAAGGEVSMHPRPLNEKGGNDSMCASIGQQTKEQTTHWSKLQAIRLERERVRMWSQPTIHLIPKCTEQ